MISKIQMISRKGSSTMDHAFPHPNGKDHHGPSARGRSRVGSSRGRPWCRHRLESASPAQASESRLPHPNACPTLTARSRRRPQLHGLSAPAGGREGREMRQKGRERGRLIREDGRERGRLLREDDRERGRLRRAVAGPKRGEDLVHGEA